MPPRPAPVPALLLLAALCAATAGDRCAAAADQPAADRQPAPKTDGRAEIQTPPPAPAPAVVDAPYLGLFSDALPLSRGAELGLPEATGLQVLGVDSHGPAAGAGLRAGDVLARLDDQILVNPAQLRVLVRMHKPGTPMTFEVLRGGNKLSLAATTVLRSMPALPPGGEPPRVTYVTGQGAGAVRSVPILPGEPLPQEFLKDMPPELRRQVERMALEQAGAAPGARVVGQAIFSSHATSHVAGHVVEVEHGIREHLKITGKDGQVVYDGPIPADAKTWEQIPESVRAKAKALSERPLVHVLTAESTLEIAPDGKEGTPSRPGDAPAPKPAR